MRETHYHSGRLNATDAALSGGGGVILVQLARAHQQWGGHIRGMIEDSAHLKAPSIIATLPIAV
jgi:hypothetical protein